MSLPRKNILITGARKGIGRYLAEYYLAKKYRVIGCSREASDLRSRDYVHFCLNVSDEKAVKRMFEAIAKDYHALHVLINNAGIASMNHTLLTPLKTLSEVYHTNVFGTFLMCREAAKLMRKAHGGRIVNFATIATPMRLEGEAAYASSKAAVESLTRIMAAEFAPLGITVNAVGPTPVKTDLIRSVSPSVMSRLINRQPIKRFGEFADISNVTDFFIRPESDFITGQIIYLGGV